MTVREICFHFIAKCFTANLREIQSLKHILQFFCLIQKIFSNNTKKYTFGQLVNNTAIKFSRKEKRFFTE